MNTRGGPSRLRRDVGCLWPALGVAAGLAAGVVFIGLGAATRSARVALVAATPAVIRVAAPTGTPTPLPTVPLPTPTVPLPSAGPGGPFLIGDLVEVFGTGGDGVRLRSAPSLGAAGVGLGKEGDTFQVTDGPAEDSGHVWWYLVYLEDSGRQGWAVAEFLRPLQSP